MTKDEIYFERKKSYAIQPFIKVHKLSDEGIMFVEPNINTEKEKLWEDFL